MSKETKPGNHSGAPGHSGGYETHGARYEKRDANTSALLKFGFWMAVVLIITMVSMKWLFGYFEKSLPMGNEVSPLTTERILPPAPRLQAQPHQELKNYCSSQMQVLDTYGWVDKNAGTARIPVDRAMDLLLQKGFPVRSSSSGLASSAPVPESSAPMAGVPQAFDTHGQCGYVNEEDPKLAPKE